MTDPPLRFGLETWCATGAAPGAGRIVYVANRASIAADGVTHGRDQLRDAGAALRAIWAPEHGYRADAPPGREVEDATAMDGIPVHSLYGVRFAPTAAMLGEIDTIVFDLQDVGARYFTYWYVLKRCLRAAEAAGKRVVICDRPNPLGPATRGNVLPPDADAQVGCWPLAMQHGMTTGDVTEAWARAHPAVEVIRARMTGWRRRMTWADLGTPWRAPSPNLSELAAVAAYPATCLAEGLTLSVGRGTPWPFRWLGAPWLAADAVADDVNAFGTGWRADVEACVPEQEPYAGDRCAGVVLTPTAPGADPFPAVLTALRVARKHHPAACRFHESHFDALAGGSRLREGLLAGRPVPTLMEPWAAQRTAALRPPADIYG